MAKIEAKTRSSAESGGGKTAKSNSLQLKGKSGPKLKRPSRVIIDRVEPEIDGGASLAKASLNEERTIAAIVLCDGHEKLKVELSFRKIGARRWEKQTMRPGYDDYWYGEIPCQELGIYEYKVEAAIDRFATWSDGLTKKLLAAQNVENELKMGQQWLKQTSAEVKKPQQGILAKKSAELEALIKAPGLEAFERWLEDESFTSAIAEHWDPDSKVVHDKILKLQVEPKLAEFSAWYEFFPRSTGENGQHGTFKTSEKMLDHIADLGFNVVYLPPIHPIGHKFRKGKNNSLEPTKDDVGSPWAIGNASGGHKAIHKELGTMSDFSAFVAKAEQLNLNVALDIAFQCAPDHPYVKEHPEWFIRRPDGSIQYAENPPKKYQDIYPFNFECDDWQNLWIELKSVFEFWIDKGVKVFRVDNPHTKPLAFWEWLILEVKEKHPEVIFLAEAFTKPWLMAKLAKLGFSQSYTYFAWREEKRELLEYMETLTGSELKDYFRPNFWPNTPDILTSQFSKSDKESFQLRLILAATLTSNYGVYGPAYELLTGEPVKKGSEEYLDSEKYQLRQWDLKSERSIAPLMKKLNAIRRESKALQTNQNFLAHEIKNDQMIAYSKTTDREAILCVVNLDPENTQASEVFIPLKEWGLSESSSYDVHDLLTDTHYTWQGWWNYVALDPKNQPAHILRIYLPKKDNSQTEKGN